MLDSIGTSLSVGRFPQRTGGYDAPDHSQTFIRSQHDPPIGIVQRGNQGFGGGMMGGMGMDPGARSQPSTPAALVTPGGPPSERQKDQAEGQPGQGGQAPQGQPSGGQQGQQGQGQPQQGSQADRASRPVRS